MEKTTTRRVSSSELRNYKPIKRQQFELYGVVLKRSRCKSILFSRGDTNVNYWINYDLPENLDVGGKYKLIVEIKSFIGRDNTFKTSIDLIEWEDIEDETLLNRGLDEVGYSRMCAKIEDVIETKTSGLYILKIRRMHDLEPQETYYMRYYTNNLSKPKLETVILTINLNQSKMIYNTEGESFTDIQTREVTDENGKPITIEHPVYRPTLRILEIYS